MPAKKLIEFGWDEPDPSFLQRHADQLAKSPFDGCVFHLPAGLTWQMWGSRALTDDEAQGAIDALRARPTTRCDHHFLRFNTAPAKLDWFDDHQAPLANARTAARIARAGRCAGVLFDIEQYEGQLFNYRKLPGAEKRGWDAYAARVREIGRHTMEAFQSGFPGLTVFLTYGYGLPWLQSGQGKKPLADTEYGLLAPFLDGLVDGARGRTKLVDGNESAYWQETPEKLAAGKALLEDGVRPIVADFTKYRKRLSVSFGLWMDFDWRAQGWNTDDPSKNPRTPERFAELLKTAWRLADDYVWIYTETPRWWSESGAPEKLPAAYDAAVRRGVGR